MRSSSSIERRRSGQPLTGRVIAVASFVAAALIAAASAMAGAPDPDFDYESEAALIDAVEAEQRRESVMERDESVATPIATPNVVPIDIAPPAPAPRPAAPRPVLDPSARLLGGDDASEAWTLYIELESGHRISQRFLLTNAGPGEHSAVAVGHLTEPGRAPFRYENGRRKGNWTLSDDRLFFDISASHLDLHRPNGELRITKDEIEIRLFFDFAATDVSARVPANRLPPRFELEVLAVGAPTRGSIKAPWMSEPLTTTGRTWLVHSWTNREEADLFDRRVEVYAEQNGALFYGVQFRNGSDWQSAWALTQSTSGHIIESSINEKGSWTEISGDTRAAYPAPQRFNVTDPPRQGVITLNREWLRFDPLEVIPNPFRWFIRRKSKPQEVWADAQIGGSLLITPETPPLPNTGSTTSDRNFTATSTSRPREASRSPNTASSNMPDRAPLTNRETENETALGDVRGVASITFLNPINRR